MRKKILYAYIYIENTQTVVEKMLKHVNYKINFPALDLFI